jgi:hypothetical protein
MRTIIAMFLIALCSGCVGYSHADKQGNRTAAWSFLKKAEFRALKVDKDGLEVKDAKTAGDSEMIREIYELGKAVGKKTAGAQ